MHRAAQLGPILFALSGAGVGICAGMLAHNEPPYQVHFDDSIPLTLLGAVIGAVAGCVVSAICVLWPQLVRLAGLATVALLGAALAAPLGWIAGTAVASERLPRSEVKEDVQHLPPIGMTVGAAIGCVMGLALGALQLRLDRSRDSDEQVVPVIGHANEGLPSFGASLRVTFQTSASQEEVPAKPHPAEPASPVPLQGVPRPPEQTAPIPEHRSEERLEAYQTEPVPMPPIPEPPPSSIQTDVRWRGINPYLTGITFGIIALIVGFLIGFVYWVVTYLRYAD